MRAARRLSRWPGGRLRPGPYRVGERRFTSRTEGSNMLRRRMQQDDAGGSAPPNVYKMRQSLVSIGDDYWIENGAGQRAFKVDGKVFRIRKTLVIEDPAGNEVATLKEKLVSIRDEMTIERGGQVLATVKKALFTPLRERFSVDAANGISYDVKGNITDHQYEFERDG